MTSDAPSRRRLLVGGAAAATAMTAQGVTAGPAAAAYAVRPYSATPRPTYRQLHYLNRLGCGFSPSSFAQLRRAGSASAWLTQQLAPARIGESTTAAALPGWFPDLREPASTKWTKNTSGVKGGWEYAKDLASYTMLRRIHSTRPVLETMVDFWSNHLHVHANNDLAWVHRMSYDDVIRRHALGRFDEMLVEAALHPAMLLYLDNWRSVRNAPNENQGRELLELHTVGRASGYTEQMVKDSAKILSGFTVRAFDTWAGYYDPAKHTTGPVQVLGFTSANASPDGQALTREYLRYLARHSATATNIATKLARYFVSDSPSASLVGTVAKAFRDSGTDIKATLRALVAHPDFIASRGRLTRTPIEDFVATARVLRVAPRKPTSDASYANAIAWVPQSILVYQWPRPDGSPRGDAAWASATRMLSSFQMHWNLAGAWWPRQGATYRTAAAWLPKASIRLDQYVDHLCRVLLGRSSTPRILGACVAATGYPPGTVVTREHPIASWLFVRLIGVLLDSPEHMRR
ncbi:MAG: DUF1800 domain-containing protein [Nocardioidaceae bacterium]|nr:DUF1800 domain-containing protein [Nocardioidaceae bacterium]NUS52886.1 DUF1800 domain-containing protein [Nocardioidaceae bacterium]